MNRFFTLFTIVPLVIFLFVGCNPDEEEDEEYEPIEFDYRNDYIGYYDCIMTGYMENDSAVEVYNPIGLTVNVTKSSDDMIFLLDRSVELTEDLNFSYFFSPVYGTILVMSGHFKGDSIFIVDRTITDSTFTYRNYKGKKE